MKTSFFLKMVVLFFSFSVLTLTSCNNVEEPISPKNTGNEPDYYWRIHAWQMPYPNSHIPVPDAYVTIQQYGYEEILYDGWTDSYGDVAIDVSGSLPNEDYVILVRTYDGSKNVILYGGVFVNYTTNPDGIYRSVFMELVD